ncbi:unnamed protein product [Brassica rapa subsp. narinosa]|uniref:(rape) hypothetical protein n=1 Tax=Brassica napus TaxID=3708 RepID=A0A816V9M3_BRANA|nr:unnamed protein product [Brassica napus]
MTDKQQKEALGETYLELVSRLDEALLSFDEGLLHLHCRDSVRSFWLQGVSTQSSQSLLSKRFVFEIITFVMFIFDTSSLIIKRSNGRHKNGTQPNGIEAVVGGDKDEIMTEVEEEEADVDDAMTIDMETIDEPSETMTTTASEKPSEIKPSSDSMAAEEGDSRLP